MPNSKQIDNINLIRALSAREKMKEAQYLWFMGDSTWKDEVMERKEVDWNIVSDKTTIGNKHDIGKLRMDLLPIVPLQEMARVLTYGASKYGDRNWENGIEWGRIYGALQRHVMAFWSGEEVDKESGISHLAHTMCCVAFLLEYQQKPDKFKKFDNR